MDSTLLSFISTVQLKASNSKIRSENVLRTLASYAEGTLNRGECIRIIEALLKSDPLLQEEFCEIAECVPKPYSRSGRLVDDSFVNTVVEFELWPGVLEGFLKNMRRVILGNGNIIDAFVDLESVKPTSGPFWLLWDLFRKISGNNHFLQLVFDGCVNQKSMPVYLKVSIVPSELDQNPSLVCLKNIVESDLVCHYKKDCRGPNRALGLWNHGSYGLLKREDVDNACSGRRVDDFMVLNDRWSTSASGHEVQFCAVRKNQYEERMFLNEDERIEVDVRISRMRNTLRRLLVLQNKLKDGSILVTSKEELNSCFTSLDVLTLQELYSESFLESILEKLFANPISMLEIVMSRIESKITQLNEFRRGKEAEYYDFNKRNTRKSLDVRNEAFSVQFEQFFTPFLYGKKHELVFNSIIAMQVYTVLTKVSRSPNFKIAGDATIKILDNFIMVVLGLKEPPTPSKSLPTVVFPSNTSGENLSIREYIMSSELYKILAFFHTLVESITVLSGPRPQQAFYEGNASDARGYQVAIALGHVNPTSVSYKFSPDIITDHLPNFICGGKHNSILDTFFDVSSISPLSTLDSFKKAVLLFLKTAPGVLSDAKSIELIDALQYSDNIYYRASCLKSVSECFSVHCSIRKSEEDIRLDFVPEVPRVFKTRKTYIIDLDETKGPLLIPESQIEDRYNKQSNFKKNKINSSKIGSMRVVKNDLLFRICHQGIEFKNNGNDIIQPKQLDNK